MRLFVSFCLLWGLLGSSLVGSKASFQEPSEKNVVYGMDHGTALLMDVYRPEESNGYGVVFIMGTGFTAYGEYDDVPLKELDRWLIENGIFPELMGEEGQLFGPMIEAGFTIFSINHRLAPKYTIWAQVKDCQRAVQYVRYHAKRYGISAERIGGLGHSSGATMTTFLGLYDDVADPEAFDPVSRESSRLQAIAPVSGLHDFSLLLESADGVKGFLSAVIGRSITYQPPGHPVFEAYGKASPIEYVTSDDAAVLLMHGTADEAVAVEQSRALAEACEETGLEFELIELEGASHAVLLEPVEIQPGPYAAEWMAKQLMVD